MLAHKNQLPFFFLCAKYGPKVYAISRQYGKRVQQSFLFETQEANMTLHNGGALGLGTTRNVSDVSNSPLQQSCVAMACSLVSYCLCFLLQKELPRNLDYHSCQVRNM